MSLVTQDKFDELVNNSTTYLQQLFDRVGKLEAKVEELEAKVKSPTKSRSKANES